MNLKEFKEKIGFEITPIVDAPDKQYVIYFLIKGDIIVYVGITSFDRIKTRLSEHRKDKDFNSFSFFNTFSDRQGSHHIERYLIRELNPKYNKTNVNMYKNEESFCIEFFDAINLINKPTDGLNDRMNEALFRAAFQDKQVAEKKKLTNIFLFSTPLFLSVLVFCLIGLYYVINLIGYYLSIGITYNNVGDIITMLVPTGFIVYLTYLLAQIVISGMGGIYDYMRIKNKDYLKDLIN